MKRILIAWILIGGSFFTTEAQHPEPAPKFTRQDSLRGSLNAERAYNVLKYDISVKPDYSSRFLTGKNTITYLDSGLTYMQIDLQEPLEIDSIIQNNRKLFYTREGNVFHVYVGDSVNKKSAVFPVRSKSPFIITAIRISQPNHPGMEDGFSQKILWDGPG